MSSESPSLCPGYKQVDEFGRDEEYEDEEIFYVTLDLGNVEPTLVPTSAEYRLIGLDTPTPFLQLSGTVFKGHHDSLLGTEILFTEAKDDQDRSKRYVTPLATTERRIRFREVRLVPKNPAQQQDITSIPREENNGAEDVQAEEAAPSTIPEVHAPERITGVRSKTARKTRSSKGMGKEAKKRKVLERKDTPAMEGMKNGEPSSRRIEAMDVTEG